MQAFKGRLASHTTGEDWQATILVGNEFVAAHAGMKRIGSWARADVLVERVTATRFQLTLDDRMFTFITDEASDFAASIDVVIDLRSTARFGIGSRVRRAIHPSEVQLVAASAED